MGTRTVPAHQLLLLALGFCVWFSALVIVYVLHTVGCTFAWPTMALRLSLAVTLLLHLALIGWSWRSCARKGADPAFGQTGSFLHWVTLWTLIAAFVTIVFTLGSTLLLTTCI